LPISRFEGGDPGFVLLKEIGRRGVLVEGAGLIQSWRRFVRQGAKVGPSTRRVAAVLEA
jgi:hypothetical protein